MFTTNGGGGGHLTLGFAFGPIAAGSGTLEFWGRAHIDEGVPPPHTFKIIIEDSISGQTEVFSSAETEFDYLSSPLIVPIESLDWQTLRVYFLAGSQNDADIYDIDAVRVCANQ